MNKGTTPRAVPPSQDLDAVMSILSSSRFPLLEKCCSACVPIRNFANFSAFRIQLLTMDMTTWKGEKYACPNANRKTQCTGLFLGCKQSKPLKFHSYELHEPELIQLGIHVYGHPPE